METVVDITIPTDQFVLEDTLTGTPDVEFESVRFALGSSECGIPFLWGSANQPDRLDAALQDDPSTRDVSRLSKADGRSLYAIDWTEHATGVIDNFAETAGSVLDIRGTSDRWTLEILFPDRPTASDTFDVWCENGIDPSLVRISNLSCREDDEMGLSATQHSTIVKAFETDYYDVPRGTTLEELAADFEVSHQALSERLRRGHSHLVQQMLSDSSAAAAGRR